MSSDYRSGPGQPPFEGSGPANPGGGWGMPNGGGGWGVPNGGGAYGNRPTTDPLAGGGAWLPQPLTAGLPSGTLSAAGPSGTLAEESPWNNNGDLRTACKAEYERVTRELDEIRLIIKQTSSDLEKLNQRKVLTAAQTREMEERIETFSRQEIRAAYLASTEAEMRAFMMNEQRDQLVAKQKTLERYQQFLAHTSETLTAMAEQRASAAWGSTPSGLAAGSRSSGGLAQQASLPALARAIQAEEDVRQRVAQYLHDGPAQSLANVVLTAEICEKLLQSDPNRVQSELGNLKSLVNATLQDTRKFIFELRPMTLDDLGLVATLRRYLTDVGAKYQVQTAVVAPQGEQRLPSGMEVPIFRVAQEAITNAVQHGRATQVRVTITIQPEGAVLTVEDNGAGFDVEQALTRAAMRRTYGIASMQERAEMLGGWLRMESMRGQGSRVELSAPMA